MIRNIVIHLNNEQPLLADLFDLPTATDAGLVCTNLRTADGRRPTFVDRIEATFFFPYLHIRFLEIPTEVGSELVPAAVGGAPDTEPEPDLGELEIDEDFLRRVREA